MAFATVTSKGQTTIPKDVRAAANLKPGDRIHLTVLEAVTAGGALHAFPYARRVVRDLNSMIDPVIAAGSIHARV